LFDLQSENFDNLYAGALHQFTKGQLGLSGLCSFLRSVMVGADKFPFGVLSNKCSAVIYCLTNLILEGFVGFTAEVWKFFLRSFVFSYCIVE